VREAVARAREEHAPWLSQGKREGL
jgi:hypothetical protein